MSTGTQFNKKLDDILRWGNEAIEIVDDPATLDNNYHMFTHSMTSRLEELLHKIKQRATYK